MVRPNVEPHDLWLKDKLPTYMRSGPNYILA